MMSYTKQIEYERKYSKIIVTYYDNKTLEFNPTKWAIFEQRVKKIAKKIEYIGLDGKPTELKNKNNTLPIIVIAILSLIMLSWFIVNFRDLV